MKTTTEKTSSSWQAPLTGAIGFFLSALAGILAGILFFRLGIYQMLINLVPEDQPLIRLYTALILLFLGVGLGGAVYGVLSGTTLLRIDPQGSRKRYLLGGGFAYGISYAVLLIPIILILAVIGKYNQGSSNDPFTFLALFSLVGAVYGLVSGLLLALITVKLRFAWQPLLAATLAGVLGGFLLGVLIWRHDLSLAQSTTRLQSIFFALYLCILFAGLAGGLLGLAFSSLNKKRALHPETTLEPRRAQDITLIIAGSLVLIIAIAVTNTLVNFLTIHTGTTTTSLAGETQGVGWTTLLPVTDTPGNALPDLDANAQGSLASTWISVTDGNSNVTYAYQITGSDGKTSWSAPVTVSNDPKAAPAHPQLGVDPQGVVHIVWSQGTGSGAREIRYSHCEGDACSTPVSIPAETESCSQQTEAKAQDLPAIAIAKDGTIAAAWNAGGMLAYTLWQAGGEPDKGAIQCLLPGESADMAIQPRLATTGEGKFALIYGTVSETESQPINQVEINKDGRGEATKIGEGRFPEVYSDTDTQIHTAWCDANGALNYMPADGTSETIAFPPCINRPEILKDWQGGVHLVWYSNQVKDNFGNQQPGHFIYETFKTDNSWSEATIVTPLTLASSPAAIQGAAGLSLIWADNSALSHAEQPIYTCEADDLSKPAAAILQVIEEGGFHPAGYQSPFCGNKFTNFIYMPEPNPAFSTMPVTPNGGYDVLTAFIPQTRYEILISNMQWDSDQDEQSPGYQVVQGIAALYRNIKANPSAYPRGLTVRILLGNYPNIATWEYGDQIWNVIDDLRKAGVDKMEVSEIGWKLEVANFRGSYPHSHTKFLVQDGEDLVAAGFNISWLHYPLDHPSGLGDSLTDLAIRIKGPVAQPAMAAFDDEWQGSNQLVCSDLNISDTTDDWKKSCVWTTGAVSHVPEVLKYYPSEESTTAFALYRTDVYKEADRSYEAAILASEESVDAIHVNFSADFICLLNVIAPDTCTFDKALPWMKALVESVDKNRIHVRVIVENANMNGMENRVGISILEQELSRRGLSEYVEVRFFDGRVHMKSALFDHKLLIVGSQNFHYSSFSDGGLLEFAAATDSQEAITEYEKMFNYYWELAIPSEDAAWGVTGE